MNDNYPDDIRNFDNHPNSPFFEPEVCEECREEFDSDGACACEDDYTITIKVKANKATMPHLEAELEECCAKANAEIDYIEWEESN